MAIRTCKLCGGSFVAYKGQQYCSKTCADYVKKQNKIKQNERAERLKKLKEEEKKTSKLADDAVEARKHDMSYGKYKAQEYKVKIDRR
ncbi:MAG: hypothetical protein ACLUP2_04475 [Lachnospiraceae bacterium]